MEQIHMTAADLTGDRLGVVIRIDSGAEFNGPSAGRVQGLLYAVTHYLSDERQVWCRIEIKLSETAEDTVRVNQKGDHPVTLLWITPSSSSGST